MRLCSAQATIATMLIADASRLLINPPLVHLALVVDVQLLLCPEPTIFDDLELVVGLVAVLCALSNPCPGPLCHRPPAFDVELLNAPDAAITKLCARELLVPILGLGHLGLLVGCLELLHLHRHLELLHLLRHRNGWMNAMRRELR